MTDANTPSPQETKSDELHEGGCLCGAVRYRTRGQPQRVSLCACTWCQKRSGAPVGLSIYFEKSQVTFLQGEMKHHKVTTDADRWLESAFCPNCGTTVGWCLEYFPDYQGIAGGTFDQPTFWYQDPQRLVFARSKPHWFHVPDDLEVHAAMAPPPPKPAS